MSYVAAAYGLTIGLVAVYAWQLWRERNRLRAELEAAPASESRSD